MARIGLLLLARLCFQNLLSAMLWFQPDYDLLICSHSGRLQRGHFMLPAPAILWVKSHSNSLKVDSIKSEDLPQTCLHIWNLTIRIRCYNFSSV